MCVTNDNNDVTSAKIVALRSMSLTNNYKTFIIQYKVLYYMLKTYSLDFKRTLEKLRSKIEVLKKIIKPLHLICTKTKDFIKT